MNKWQCTTVSEHLNGYDVGLKKLSSSVWMVRINNAQCAELLSQVLQLIVWVVLKDPHKNS